MPQGSGLFLPSIHNQRLLESVFFSGVFVLSFRGFPDILHAAEAQHRCQADEWQAFPMKKNLEASTQPNATEVANRPAPAVEDVVASRAVATDRIFKGGSLAVLGFGGALLADFLNPGPGLALWISLSAALTAFGAGSIWAGSGASHLVRHGRKGSSLWLISLAGLGGSVILNVVSGILVRAWSLPILGGLNLLSMASCGLFTAALIVLGLITIVRWMLPDPDPMGGSTASDASGIE